MEDWEVEVLSCRQCEPVTKTSRARKVCRAGKKTRHIYLPFAVTNVGTSDVFAVEKATHSIAELFDYDPTFASLEARPI